ICGLSAPSAQPRGRGRGDQIVYAHVDGTGTLARGGAVGAEAGRAAVNRRRIANPLLRFRLPAMLLAAVIVYGVVGYVLINHWSLHGSVAMTIVTLTTDRDG